MSGGFGNPIIGGGGGLVYPSIHSPNFVHNTSGWSINKDGTAEFQNAIITGTVNAGSFAGTDFIINASGIFFYAGTPGAGNLVASIATVAGTDSFGNPYPAGEAIGLNANGQIQLQPNVNQPFDITSAIAGVFTAMAQYFTGDSNQVMPSMLGSMLLGTGTATKMTAVMHSPFGTTGAALLLEAENDGGTDTPVITFGTVTMPDGVTMVFTPIMTLYPYALILYSGAGSLVTVTKTTGSGTIAIPVGVTTVKAESWGGGGGGSGGTAGIGALGGWGGGGGEYAQEASLAVTGGGTVSYSVGGGGAAGAAGAGTGGNGSTSTLTGTSVTVTANGGTGGKTLSGGSPGVGGSGSTNTIHFNGGGGGNGGSFGASQQFGNGGGGASSGGAGSAGHTGGNATSGGGGAGGTAVAGGGAGGNGAGSTSNGSAGGAPGGAGGGGGAATAGGGSSHAGGAGSSGQVRITYTTGNPTVGFAVNFGAAITDQFGNSIPAGPNLKTDSAGALIVKPNLELTAPATAPAAPATGVKLYAEPAGSTTPTGLAVATSTGFTGYLPVSQAVQGGNTNNTTSLNAMFTPFSIPANDAQSGTTYKITCGGHGTQALTTATTLNFQIFAFGLAWGASTDGGNVPAGATFHWWFEGELIIGTPGASAPASFFGTMVISQAAASAQGHPTAMDTQRANGVNTTASTNISLQAGWTSVANSPTLVCTGAVFERIGP